MTHPLVPEILDLAAPVAEDLELEVVKVVFHTNQSPPILRVDIRNPIKDTSLNDCERMSRNLEATLDAASIIPDAYVLEVSSPGISQQLQTDREFNSFKGFPIKICTSSPHQGQSELNGKLVRRDQKSVYLNKKGRVIEIPRSNIISVLLDEERD
ncbi:MAG: ribosome maturation factor RimP [Rivularia sp. (in: cyanobacteria)]